MAIDTQHNPTISTHASEKHPPLWLASGSPRRAELLRQIQVPFIVLKMPPGLDPEQGVKRKKHESPSHYALRLSLAKAIASIPVIENNKLPRAPVLTADTVVIVDDKIFGKPKSIDKACDMLARLSGRSHHVVTAVTLYKAGGMIYQTLADTVVTFSTLAKKDIERYVHTCNVMDKAGAYAIQEYAGSFVESIKGSYSNVVGLPLYETAQLLRCADIRW